jgi:HSP20 family molecular chaperone IbpA
MWADACQRLDHAERLHHQFFRLDFPRGARVAWEPPVDVFEDEYEFVIVIALPGVLPASAEVLFDGHTLLIRACRQVPLPHGYFERRLLLPKRPLQLESRQWSDGCLVLTLRKIQ